MHVAQAMVSLEHRISGCNPSMAAVVGYSCEVSCLVDGHACNCMSAMTPILWQELVNLTILECFHVDDGTPILRNMKELLATAAAAAADGGSVPLWRVLNLRVKRKVSYSVECHLVPCLHSSVCGTPGRCYSANFLPVVPCGKSAESTGMFCIAYRWQTSVHRFQRFVKCKTQT